MKWFIAGLVALTACAEPAGPAPQEHDSNAPAAGTCAAACRAVFYPGEAAAAVEKDFFVTRWKANRVRLALGRPNPRTLEIAADLAEALYVASQRGEFSPTEAQLRDHYQRHRNRFASSYQITFLQATLRRAEGASAAAAALTEAYRALTLRGEIGKVESAQFALNLETVSLSADRDDVHASFLRSARVGEVASSGSGESQTLVLLTERSGGEPQPFDQVSAEVRNAVVEARRSQWATEVQRRIDRRFAIQVRGRPEVATDPPHGSVGSLAMDAAFLVAVKAVVPRFHFSHDPADFETLVTEFYARPMAEASLAREGALDADTHRNVLVIRRIAEDRVLAREWHELPEAQITVSDREVRDFYRAHHEEFRTAPVIEGYIAEVRGDADAAQRELQELEFDDPDHKFESANLRAVFVPDLRAEVGEAAQDAPIDHVVTRPERRLLRVTQRQVGRVPPFSVMREPLLERVRAQKMAELEEEIREQAMAQAEST